MCVAQSGEIVVYNIVEAGDHSGGGCVSVSFDQRLSSIAEALQSAALGLSSWDAGLKVLADATGAKSGELLGLGSTPFHIITEISDEEMASFIAANGHDPAVNSRVRSGMRAPVLRLLDEAAFDTEGDCRRSLAYGDVIQRLDIPYAHLTILHRSSDLTLGLCLLRTQKAGDMPAEEKALLRASAHHVVGAMRFHMAAELRAMELTAAGFEKAEQAVFVLDRSGRLRAMSEPAQRLLQEGSLRVKDGRLSTADSTTSLGLAIHQALHVKTIADAPPRPILGRHPCGTAYLIEILPLPSREGFDFEAGALLLARPPRVIERRAAAVAAEVFGLTPAEASVAGLLASGITAGQIAARQGVAIGTVRTHVRRLFEKTGSKNQTALVAEIVSRL